MSYVMKPAELAIFSKPELTVSQAIQYLTSGAVSPEAYAQWQSDRENAARASATECPFGTFAEFSKALGSDEIALAATGGDKPVNGKPKEFSTGSFGLNFNGKVTIKVGGKPVKFQFSGNAVAIGSKPAAVKDEGKAKLKVA